MEPFATYDEIAAMDDSTFVKTFKEKQLEEAKKVKDNDAKTAIYIARDAELKTFDDDAKIQIANLQSALSAARTVIEQKYADQISAVDQVI